MKVYYGPRKIRVRKGSVVTIGIFDGVHRGHAKVISRAVASAARRGLTSAVVTFVPHPLRVLHPSLGEPKTLLSLSHRLRLIGGLGVDNAVVVRFTGGVRRLEPFTFIERYLVRALKAKTVVVGGDFHFGRRRSGDTRVLRLLGGVYGFTVTGVKPLKVGGRTVSSSLIRRLITKGDLAAAASLLGRPVSVLGTVVRGARIGRALGYPTANIDPHHETIPPSGVYAVMVKHRGRLYGGALNIGFRPTVKRPAGKTGPREEPSIEVHIFDFRKRIYREEVEIFFVRRLRPEKRFAGRASLMAQIRIDEARARSILRRTSLSL